MISTNKYFVIFGGGGVRGLAYCGAYKALIENNIEMTGCAGSSIGAVFASLLSVGYSCSEIYDLLSNTGFKMFSDINFDISKEIAFSKGNIFYEWIKENIEKKFYGENYQKGNVEPVTFKDIKSKLIIFSVDLDNMKYKEFSNTATADFEIAKAVRASVSMPGLFSPLEIDGTMVVDGDLLKSAPLWRITNTIKDVKERIIEFRLEDNQTRKKITNPLEYLNRVYNAISGFATDYIIDLYGQKDKFDYIKINTPDISVVDFLISKEKKQEIYDIGFKTTNEYFKNVYPFKKNFLKEKYKDLFMLITKFEKEFNKTNIINSYLKLCEIFVYLCEEKKYIDSEIYEKILNFKNKYTLNYESKHFLFSKQAAIKNKEELSSDLLELIKLISFKVDEFKN